ncbi:MAG: hypothetical protein C4527_25765 [Candidatus Omnitrophota bacterium]|jgi:hypothetical protein|nr:MAG: hypothetical protein C4527_25765 [Candidatus Omnitrophota bacterium]
MTKTTELIDEITHEFKRVRALTEDLREHYRTLGALLLSAKTLAPIDRWEAWLQANIDLDLPTAEVVIDGDRMNPQWNPLILPNQSSAWIFHEAFHPAMHLGRHSRPATRYSDA